MYHPTDRITHTTVFVTPAVQHWLEREIAHLTDRSDETHRTISIRSTTEQDLACLEIRSNQPEVEDFCSFDFARDGGGHGVGHVVRGVGLLQESSRGRCGRVGRRLLHAFVCRRLRFWVYFGFC